MLSGKFNKVWKIQSCICLIPFIGFLVVIFWAMITCHRVTKSFFGVLKWYLFIIGPWLVFSIITYILIYYIAVPMLQTEQQVLGVVLILVFAYILAFASGITAVFMERLVCKPYLYEIE